jgi:phage terminase large subunit-like protein
LELQKDFSKPLGDLSQQDLTELIEALEFYESHPEILDDDKAREFLKNLQDQVSFDRADPLSKFRPIAGHQEEFLKSQAPLRVIVAANQGGKTTAGAIQSLRAALNRDPYRKWVIPNRGKIGTHNWDLIGDFDGKGNIIPKLNEWCPAGSIAHIEKDSQSGCISLIRFKNGSVMEFFSYKQERGALQAGTYHYAWFDEEVPETLFNEVRRGLLKHGGRTWMTMTLLANEPWIERKLLKKADTKNIEVFEWDMAQNPFLPKESIDSFFLTMSPEEKERRKMGRLYSLSGRVFEHFSPRAYPSGHIIPPVNLMKNNWDVYECIDPHDSEADYVSWVARSPQNRFYIVGEAVNNGPIGELPDIIFAKRMKLLGRYNSNRVVATFIDYSLANIHRKERDRSWASELKDAGIFVKNGYKHNKGAMLSKIDDMCVFKATERSDVKLPDLMISSDCPGHIEQFDELHYTHRRERYPEYGYKAEPEKVNDHFPDNIRIIISTIHRPNQTKNIKPIYYAYGTKH